jgi:hypothetical protein
MPSSPTTIMYIDVITIHLSVWNPEMCHRVPAHQCENPVGLEVSPYLLVRGALRQTFGRGTDRVWF